MNKKLILVVGIIVGLLVTGLAGFAAEKPGEGVTVTVGRATWQSAKPVEAVTTLLMERLGYDVKPPKSMSNPIFYQSLALGDLDYWPNVWWPLHKPQLPEDFEESATILGQIVKNGAIQGFLVDKKTAEKFDIVSLTDFKRPEVIEAFDYDDNGKANLGGCPPGWGCEEAIKRMLDNYKLRDYIEVAKPGYSAMFADRKTRYSKGESIFFYTWTPNYTVLQLAPGEDVVWINTPYISITNEAQQAIVDARGPGAMVVHNLEGAVTEYIHTGWPPGDIRFAANNEFLDNNPAAKKLMELVSIPMEDLNEMTRRISEGEDERSDVLGMAESWLQENDKQVQEWLDAAMDAAK